MRKFWFGGRCSAEFGMMATGSGTYNAPERDLEMISIPGRNGDLILDNGRFRNIPVTYPISICRDFARKAEAARAWLLSETGYRKLEDEYNPDFFRLGVFKGPIDFDVSFLSRTGEASLTFDCKPQRFYRAGEHPVLLMAPGSLWNPSGFPALPRIILYGNGSGTLTVGETVVEVKSLDGHLILDSDTQNAWRTTGNGGIITQNGAIYAPDFPVLGKGRTPVTWTGGIETVEIIPRWWTV